jgi:hypothetical protein
MDKIVFEIILENEKTNYLELVFAWKKHYLLYFSSKPVILKKLIILV